MATKTSSTTKKNTTKKTTKTPMITAGDRTCYVYFDTEFTGLRKGASLISIGLVTSEGRTFYAEFTDYNIDQVDQWINDNVISNLIHPENNYDGDHWTMQGTTEDIREQLWMWLAPYKENGKLIQFVSDVCHYDFVFLIDLLLGDYNLTAIDLPDNVSATCLDINQDIATAIQRTKPEDVTDEEFNKNFVPVYASFNMNREDLVAGIPSFNYEGKKHNSLYDAMVIRAIHQHLWDIA